MSRVAPLSGFPEFLPAGRVVEQRVIAKLAETFELYGFASVNTRSIEPMDQLLRKGETSKEVYVLRRLQAEAESGGDTGFGLHFDLTVPFARYVLENAGKLQFPFRRYQIQPCWRGERPQDGRFREFWQADIDIVDRDELPTHYEVEIPLVVGDALRSLPIPDVRIHVNNRKLSQGFYQGLGLSDPMGAIRAVDKIDKVGPAGVAKLLSEELGAADDQVKACLALAEIATDDESFVDAVRALGVSDPLLDEGLDELATVIATGAEDAPGLLRADMRIARGLDYYTGTVYETFMDGYGRLGSVCSGGRYDNLASDGKNSFPGVGISIGISRILVPLVSEGKLGATRDVPTCVLVALPDTDSRRDCDRIAAKLRSRGVATEVAPAAQKYGKQIKFAERRGIPFVLFPSSGTDGHEIRDIRSGEQSTVDIDSWLPPTTDLRAEIQRTGE
ncbi:histidine--tRNA ligase [Stackebrandtia nassauensis]|uniref:Histidine--tRNA ligase n=1 Tax=Stackebrandtia nassauensis (strain DSM 44728 / CIP 108903 / NRRL B-16338 / NBRC 102104 / LLR-40K-21) TaxID=446470 RepID=D3PYP0_STANL|nr:histidine--tRNA ligase [Stackebrandtia nassauensis]ADD43473.1 histidyl-tRNA synthetase [Stackebrandtia nassauensis DSM 44728]